MVGSCLALSVIPVALWQLRVPAYGGHTVNFWIKHLPQVRIKDPRARVSYSFESIPVGSAKPNPEDIRRALAAIRAIGTNGLPFLMSKFRREPPHSRLSKLAQRYAVRIPLAQELFPSAGQIEDQRAQAVTGLLAVCPLPPSVLEELRTLSLEFKGSTWSIAGDILRANDNPAILHDALSPYESQSLK
jgi:hypothetical protein